LELDIEWVGVLAFGEKLLGNLQSYAWTVSGKNRALPLYW